MFKKAKRRSTELQATVISKAMGGLNGVQHQVAGRLNDRTRHWSSQRKRWFLIIVVVAMQGFSFTWLYLQYRRGDSTTLQTPTNLPAMNPAGTPPAQSPFKTAQAAAIHRLRLRFERMARTPAGRDSLALIEAHRPGFIDSVHHADERIQGIRR